MQDPQDSYIKKSKTMTNPKLFPEAQQQLQASIKAIEELGAKFGEIGAKQQKQAVENVNEIVKKINKIKV